MVAPTVAVTIFESTRHVLLDNVFPIWTGPAVVFAAVGVSSFFFSQVIFRTIESMQAEVLRRNQELSARNEVGIAVAEAQALDDALGRALETVLRITGAEAGDILVLEEETGDLVTRVHRGIAGEVFTEMTRFRPGNGLPGIVVQTGEPILVQDMATDPRFIRKRLTFYGFHAYAGTPLKSKNRVVGVIEVVALDPRQISRESLDLLSAIGNQIGVAIENARLMEQMRYLAILEERDRLGREIHDSFAQTLGYLNMQGRAIENLLLKGKTDQALGELRQMGDGVRGAFSDVREAIFSLRTTLEPERDLVSTLQEYIHEFSRNSDISVDLLAPEDQEIRLPPETQVQLVRVVQEALRNTRKYADASHATVRVAKDESGMTLSIEDDGDGFDIANPGNGHQRRFGLSIMKERTEAVGAAFSINSQPGQGTRVLIELPGGKVAE